MSVSQRHCPFQRGTELGKVVIFLTVSKVLGESDGKNGTSTEIFRTACGMGRGLTEELEVRSLGVSDSISATIHNVGPEGNATCPGEDSTWKACASEFALRSGAFLGLQKHTNKLLAQSQPFLPRAEGSSGQREETEPFGMRHLPDLSMLK